MTDEALLVPVGHDLGVLYAMPGSDDHCQQVRAGVDVAELNDTDFAVWLLAHGLTDQDRPTRSSLRAAAAQLGLDEPVVEEVINRFLADGLLVELSPHGPDAVEFAERHQLVPLMLGLGADVDAPWLRTIGLLNQPVAQVSNAMYDVWAWAHLAPHLWAGCHDAAEVARLAGATEAEALDPRQVLAGLLGSVHALLCTRAAYFDRRGAREGAV